MERFDLIVVGGGSAAKEAVARARFDHGASVAAVNRGVWGGICGSTACKPTKQLLVAAELLTDLRRVGADLGIEAGSLDFSLAVLKARKDWLVGSPDARRRRWVDLGATLVEGEGTLVDPETVRVGDRLLGAPRILIATGSRTAVPPIEGIEDVPWIDHVGALELTGVPESLLVLGGGPVGLELAQLFFRFGARVTLVQAEDRIAPRADADASGALRIALEDEGIAIATATEATTVRREQHGIVVTLAPREGGVPRELRTEVLLVASGRSPNVEGLGLEGVGVETSPDGIVTDDRMRTTAAGIWAVGDVVAGPQLTPVAAEQAQIAVASMFGDGTRSADYSLLPTAIFTDPELASVGMTEAEARVRGIDVGTSTKMASDLMRPYFALPRDDTPRGLVKLVYERGTRRLLGVHAVARGGGEIVQGWSLAIARGVTLDDVTRGFYALPTVGEAVHHAAEDALARESALATEAV